MGHEIGPSKALFLPQLFKIPTVVSGPEMPQDLREVQEEKHQRKSRKERGS